MNYEDKSALEDDSSFSICATCLLVYEGHVYTLLVGFMHAKRSILGFSSDNENVGIDVDGQFIQLGDKCSFRITRLGEYIQNFAGIDWCFQEPALVEWKFIFGKTIKNHLDQYRVLYFFPKYKRENSYIGCSFCEGTSYYLAFYSPSWRRMMNLFKISVLVNQVFTPGVKNASIVFSNQFLFLLGSTTYMTSQICSLE